MSGGWCTDVRPHFYDRNMTIPPVIPQPARHAPSRARRIWSLVGSIAIALLCALWSFGDGGNYGLGDSGYPPLLRTMSFLITFPMVAVAVLLVWRHRFPVTIFVTAAVVTCIAPTNCLAVLISLAAVTAARQGWVRWACVAGAYVAVIVTLMWNLAFPGSPLAAAAATDGGTAVPAAMTLVIIVMAAFMVAPFAAFGIARRFRGERDRAQAGEAAATRNTTTLQQEMERERERAALGRELHDTLAARLSAVSLHAGALELMVDGHDPREAAAARLVREAAQGSLDELRSVVHVLKNPQDAGPGAGLMDIAALVDQSIAVGTDLRAQLMVADPGGCDRAVSHAVYRVVQEAVSNARRYAPGAPVRLDVRGGPESGVSVTVSNPVAPGVVATSIGGGNGLVGMRERMDEVGGTFQAGPVPGGFTVLAWAPWERR